MWACGRGQRHRQTHTETHRRTWPQYISLGLLHTRNVTILTEIYSQSLSADRKHIVYCVLLVTPSMKSINFSRLIDMGVLLYIRAKIGELWPWSSPVGRQNTEGCKKLTLFSCIVWWSAMKFGAQWRAFVLSRSSSPILMHFGLLLWQHKFLTADISSRTLRVGGWRNLAPLGVWPIDTYPPNFVGPVIPCVDMHQSFTDALVCLSV